LGHYNESLTSTDFSLQLMLQTRVSYTVFVARQRYQRRILVWSCNEVYITIRRDTANWCVRNSCEKRCSLFCFRLVIVSAYINVCFSLLSTSTGSKPQVIVSH